MLSKKEDINMKAGVVIRDITPSCPVRIGEYTEPVRYGVIARDPLFATVFYLNNGTDEIVWILTDLIYLNNADAQVLRRRIAQEIGVPYENVLFSASGTHSAPQFENWDRVHLKDPLDPYLKWLMSTMDALVDASAEAKKKTFEASVGFGLSDDKSLTAMVIRDKKNVRGILVNYALTPDILSIAAYSADYVANVRKALAKSYPAAAMGFLQGAGADHLAIAEARSDMGDDIGRRAVEAVANASYDAGPVIRIAGNYIVPPTKTLEDSPVSQNVVYAYGLPVEIKALRIGDAVFALISADACSQLAAALDASTFADGKVHLVLIGTHTNGNSIGCLVDDASFDENAPDAKETSFARGCLPFAGSELRRLIQQVL